MGLETAASLYLLRTQLWQGLCWARSLLHVVLAALIKGSGLEEPRPPPVWRLSCTTRDRGPWGPSVLEELFHESDGLLLIFDRLQPLELCKHSLAKSQYLINRKFIVLLTCVIALSTLLRYSSRFLRIYNLLCFKWYIIFLCFSVVSLTYP